MPEDLMNIPTNSLIEMLFVILACKLAPTAHDATEIGQIQCELKRRGEEHHWSFRTVN